MGMQIVASAGTDNLYRAFDQISLRQFHDRFWRVTAGTFVAKGLNLLRLGDGVVKHAFEFDNFLSFGGCVRYVSFLRSELSAPKSCQLPVRRDQPIHSAYGFE